MSLSFPYLDGKIVCQECSLCCEVRAFDKKGRPVKGKHGLSLYPWEVNKIKSLALKNNVKCDIIPDIGTGELRKHGKVIGPRSIITYQLIGEPCIFLSKGKCIIYQHRPMMCRAYPLRRLYPRRGIDPHCTWVKAIIKIHGTTFDTSGLEDELEAMIKVTKYIMPFMSNKIWNYSIKTKKWTPHEHDVSQSVQESILQPPESL